jgi:hypothetical protein
MKYAHRPVIGFPPLELPYVSQRTRFVIYFRLRFMIIGVRCS